MFRHKDRRIDLKHYASDHSIKHNTVSVLQSNQYSTEDKVCKLQAVLFIDGTKLHQKDILVSEHKISNTDVFVKLYYALQTTVH